MIRLTDVVKEYPNGTHALNGLTLEIQDGEFVFMVGPSGSGKSTVIKVLIGEVEPTEGKVVVNGFSLRNIRERQIPYLRRTVGVIFQDFRLIEHKTVYDNMVFAMRAVGAGPKEIKKRIPYVLDLVGLENKSRRLPSAALGASSSVWPRPGACQQPPATTLPTSLPATWTRPAPWRLCVCWSGSMPWGPRFWW